jgi:hypothetical protein
MTTSIAFLEKYRQAEANTEPEKQTWYLAAVSRIK